MVGRRIGSHNVGTCCVLLVTLSGSSALLTKEHTPWSTLSMTKKSEFNPTLEVHRPTSQHHPQSSKLDVNAAWLKALSSMERFERSIEFNSYFEYDWWLHPSPPVLKCYDEHSSSSPDESKYKQIIARYQKKQLNNHYSRPRRGLLAFHINNASQVHVESSDIKLLRQQQRSYVRRRVMEEPTIVDISRRGHEIQQPTRMTSQASRTNVGFLGEAHNGRSSMPTYTGRTSMHDECKLEDVGSMAAGKHCQIPLPRLDQHLLPASLCGRRPQRILLLSFFTRTVASAKWMHNKKQKGNTKQKGPGAYRPSPNLLGFKNRMCFAAARGYRYVVEVIDNRKKLDDRYAIDSGNVGSVPIMLYKAYMVKYYLQFTDWLVWQDFDLIVKNPHNWFEQYLSSQKYGDDRFHLILTDHNSSINNGAFMLRNSAWSRSFVDHWIHLSSTRQYPFSDNGPFAETVLRFGSLSFPKDEKGYIFDSCLRQMRTAAMKERLKQKKRKEASANEKEKQELEAGIVGWVSCLWKVKSRLMGPWKRERQRVMGRIRFVAMANGFNAHSWKQWKGDGNYGSTNKGDRVESLSTKKKRKNYFVDSMFVLHSKDFEGRVPPNSLECPLTMQNYGGMHLPVTRIPITELINIEGSYMMSSDLGGFCDLDEVACQLAHFPACNPATKQLCPMSRAGIQSRKKLLVGSTSISKDPPPIPMESFGNIRGQKPEVFEMTRPFNIKLLLNFQNGAVLLLGAFVLLLLLARKCRQ